MAEPFCARNSSESGERLVISHIGSPLACHIAGNIMGLDGWIVFEVGDTPCCRAICHKGITQNDDWCHVFKGHLAGFISSKETVVGCNGANYRHGTFTISSVKSLKQVSLLCFGGQTCGRSTSLNVNNNQG